MYTTVTCTCMSPPKNIMCCFPCILVFAGHTMTSFCFPSSPFTFVSLLTANSSKEFLLAIFMTAVEYRQSSTVSTSSSEKKGGGISENSE